MSIQSKIGRAINNVLGKAGYELKKKYPDFYLHEYSSYEEYKAIQITYNKNKIENVWADEATLDLVVERVGKEFGYGKELFALCHGTRNGFEQSYIGKKLKVNIIGTDISETATEFSNSIQWDFHDRNEEWVGKCDFVYTNSLDQSWKPKLAITTWLDQLRSGGLLFIEHTIAHGPQGASEMDPFGVNPNYMPYVLCEWFGHQIAIEIISSTKSNYGYRVWLFVVKKL